MDLELHQKAMEKLQGEEERIEEAMGWIEAVTGIQKVGEFPDCLKSGKMLCALANTLRPGIIDKVNERPIPLLERVSKPLYFILFCLFVWFRFVRLVVCLAFIVLH